MYTDTNIHRHAHTHNHAQVPRQATVKAVGTTTLLVLRRDAFERLCGNLFEILRRDMSAYISIYALIHVHEYTHSST